MKRRFTVKASRDARRRSVMASENSYARDIRNEAERYINSDDAESAYDLFYTLWAEYRVKADALKRGTGSYDDSRDAWYDLDRTYSDTMRILEKYLDSEFYKDPSRFYDILGYEPNEINTLFGITGDGDTLHEYMKRVKL